MVAAAVEAPDATYRPVGGCLAFYTATDPEVLAVGPAGTGKTLAACWKLHHVALKVPGVRILMARKVLEDLKTGALATYTNQVQPQLDGVITFGGNRFYPGEFRYDNGSVLHVVGMDKPGKVMSAEYDIIYVNEATEIDETTWQTLKTRLRNGRLAYQQIIADCNPSYPKHWLNLRCDAGVTRRILTTHRDNPAYWDAQRNDWTLLGYQYVRQTLGTLTGAERDRLLLGKWVASEGLVYPMYVPEMQQRTDVTGWRTVMACDIGSNNPTAILTGHVSGDERVHISREFYRRGMGSTDIQDAIKTEADRCAPDVIWIDPSAKSTIIDLQIAGYPVEAANNDVLEGIRRVKSVLARGFTIDPRCTETIGEFGAYAYPRKHADDTDKPAKEHDHAMDALRYLCMGATEATVDLAAFYGDLVTA